MAAFQEVQDKDRDPAPGDQSPEGPWAEVPVVGVAARVPRVWGEPEQAARARPVEDAARGNYREISFGTSIETSLL